MPRTKTSNHPFDQIAHQFAEMVASKLGAAFAKGGAGKGATQRRSSALKGKKKDMSCRVAGCKNRSGGPYWGYICEDHRNKLSAKEQQAARDAWKA